jgi:hypothetical protein
MSNGGGEGGAGPLAAATAVAGMLAAIVGAVYVLGGLVIVLRLLVFGFEPGSVAAIVGQLPRELVITTALLDVGLPAAIVGLVAIGVAELLREIEKMPSDRKNSPSQVAVMAVISLVLIAPGVWLIYDGGREFLALSALIIGFGFATLATCVTWRGVKRFGMERRASVRLGAVGGFCALAAIMPAVLLAGSLEFEQAQACITGGRLLEKGRLIGEGGGQLLLGKKSPEEQERVVSIPSDQVTRLEYGDLISYPVCSSSPSETQMR